MKLVEQIRIVRSRVTSESPKVRLVVLVLLVGILAACNRQVGGSTQDQLPTAETSSVPVETVLQGEHIVAVTQQNEIVIVDPSFPQPTSVYSFKEGEKPLVYDIENIKLSPSREYLVWYAPLKGFLCLHIDSKQVTELYPANNWLNRYPYFVFDQDSDVIHFVDNEGTKLVNLDIVNNTHHTTQIPYPFGNFFRISPSGEYIVFVSGFGQTEEFPEYLITTINGENPVRFATQTALNKRELVAWVPDSSGIIVVEDDHNLMYIPRSNPESKELYHVSENEARIDNVRRLENLLYYFTNDNRWHVLNMDSREHVARIPIEIAEEIHRPNFIPWYDNSFLIEETLRLSPEQFNRLWLSNFMGVKKQVLEKYHEIEIRDETPEI